MTPPAPVIIAPVQGEHLIHPVDVGIHKGYKWMLQDIYERAYNPHAKADFWYFVRREQQYFACDCDDCLAEYGERPSYTEVIEITEAGK